jgi:subtilase family serine protease
VRQWLAEDSLDGEQLDLFSYGDVLRVNTSVQNAEHLFGTHIAEFNHASRGHRVLLSTQSISVPAHVAQYVRDLVGLSDAAFPQRVTSYKLKPNVDLEGVLQRRQTSGVTPAALRTHYNAPNTNASSSVSHVRANRTIFVCQMGAF